MTGLDWVIIGLVVLLALFGWAQGFVAGLLAFVGFAAGAFLGTRIAPLVLSDGNHSPYAPVFALMGALLVGAVLAVGFEGMGASCAAGWRARRRSRRPTACSAPC